jgi:hypothetical protein
LSIHTANAIVSEYGDQGRYVLAPFAQRRNCDRKDVQPKVEIAAKAFFLHHLFQVAMGCSDDADIYLLGSIAAQPFKLPFLQDPEKLGLEFERDIADLIQKKRAFVRQFEAAHFSSNRSRERSSLVTEEFALQKAKGNCGAVESYERAVTPWTEIVNRARDQFLSGPCLS